MIMSPPATFRLLGERSSVASPGIGHFYFAQRGHYHFAGTLKSEKGVHPRLRWLSPFIEMDRKARYTASVT
jgi:hypothetical protein